MLTYELLQPRRRRRMLTYELTYADVSAYPGYSPAASPGGVGGVLALGAGGGDLLKRSNSDNDLPTPAPARAGGGSGHGSVYGSLSLDALGDSLLRRSISDSDLPASREFL